LQVLTLITDRLRNETSRLAAVRAMATIARSPLPLELTDSFPPATTELIPFLRKANRQLRLSTLDALLAIIARDGPRLDPETLTNIVSEVSSLVNVSDVAVAAAALRLADKIVHEQVCVADATCATVLPSMMELLKSPLMQVQVLNAMQSLLATVVRTGAAEATPDALLGMLRGAAIAEDAGSGTPTAAAQCAASLCRAVGQRQVESTVAALLQVLASAGSSDAERRFALLTLGELGRESDLTAFPQLPEALTAALASESIAEAASLALGGVAAGNLAAFLPLVLQHVRAQAASPKQQYQLLRALNEVITTVARKTASKQQSPMSVEQVRVVVLVFHFCLLCMHFLPTNGCHMPAT
jgi:cullin-associated NEDD8-dissociated protein 1